MAHDEMTGNEQDSAYVRRCLKRLKDWGAPLDRWTCVEIHDVADQDAEVPEFFTCELCDCQKVRFVHVMRHENYFEDVSVGCICAGIMEGDILAAKERDNAMKNRARRKQRFLQRKWKQSWHGCYRTKYRGTSVLIKRSEGNRDRFHVCADGIDCWSYKGKPITNFLSAVHAAFEIVDPVARIIG
jgi:hypothetical protein